MNSLGQLTGQFLTIDSRTSFDTTFGPSVSATSAIDYSQMLSQRKEFKTCFVGNYAEYFLNRSVDKTVDGCRLNKTYQKIQDDRPLSDVVKSLALDQEFRVRKLENE